MRRCVLFGKPYLWLRGADGVLYLCGDATFVNVPQRYAMGPPKFADVVDALLEFEMSGSTEAIGGFIRDRAVAERLRQIGEG